MVKCYNGKITQEKLYKLSRLWDIFYNKRFNV